MNKLKKSIEIVALAIFAVLIIAAPSMAAISECIGEGEYADSAVQDEKSDDFPVRCSTIKDGDEVITVYGKNLAACQKVASLASNPESCKGNDLNTMVQTIINAVIFVIGMVAVVMIILGGVNYATSQGDAGKVKKGKDTILYGIIGLVIAILAFAIVNFVLQAVAG